MEAEALVLFCKLPVPGQVKTRLAAGIGAEMAAAFYSHCAQRVVSALARLSGTAIYVFYAQGEEEAAVAAWLAPLHLPRLALVAQLQAADLGARMEHALRHAFAAGHRRVAIAGTDVPDLDARVAAQALASLGTHQAVFGPADDGGFYLLALSTLPEGLFQGIEWSTASVLADTVAAVQRHGLSVAPLPTLPTLLDVDTAADLQRWCAQQQQQRQDEQKQQQKQQQQQQVSGDGDELLALALRMLAADPLHPS